MRWAIGIDPGLGETGVVLCRDADEPELVQWVTYSCPPGGDEDLTRVVSLGGAVVDCVLGMIYDEGIDQLDIGIEMPVYKHNAATFTKQIRLVEEIQSGIFHLATGEVDQMYMTEVFPSTSKMLLTEDARADKRKMISSFEKLTGHQWEDGVTLHTKETVADAYAHSLCTWLDGLRVTRLNFTKLTAAVVDMKGSWHG